MKKSARVFIGTSGWHYSDWKDFYPKDVKGYGELTFYATEFEMVENNSSFYGISRPSTYATWSKHTPDDFIFCLKLNKLITHVHKLELVNEVREKIVYILDSLQKLEKKLGAIVIQLPPSMKVDLERLETFLSFVSTHVRGLEFKPDLAIEFRNEGWFVPKTYKLLEKYNVALVASQPKTYREERRVIADFVYIRLHGPGKMFDSPYTAPELEDWAAFIQKSLSTVRRAYVCFNNTMHGHALKNARELRAMLENDNKKSKLVYSSHEKKSRNKKVS